VTYEEWEQGVPEVIKADPVWRFYAYRKALFLCDLTWEDCGKLMRDSRGRAIAQQLIRSAGSISANIEEGTVVVLAKIAITFFVFPPALPAKREAGTIADGICSHRPSWNIVLTWSVRSSPC